MEAKNLRPTQSDQIKFNVAYPPDTDYSSHARLLQSMWREKKGYPESKLGNYLEIGFAKSTMANFLTPNIRNLVKRAVENSKISGAMIGEPRIWNNLLSSQPLCFNLFGELSLDLGLASKYFAALFPHRIDSVKSVNFEYSAGRRNPEYTGDNSAFDVFIEYTKNGKKGFVGIEVKYAESLKEESRDKAAATYLKHKREYARLTTHQIFKPNAIEKVCQAPISQIWRDHLLSIAHRKDYNEGFFVFLFPKDNTRCQQGVNRYKTYLKSNSEKKNGFYPRYLDDFINVLIQIHDVDWTRELKNRYLGETRM